MRARASGTLLSTGSLAKAVDDIAVTECVVHGGDCSSFNVRKRRPCLLVVGRRMRVLLILLRLTTTDARPPSRFLLVSRRVVGAFKDRLACVVVVVLSSQFE